MKKKLVIIISILILTGLIAFTTYSNYTKEKASLTGETITGEATDATLAVAVSVTVGGPTISVILPKNETYISPQNLRLNYSGNNINLIWYNIDEGANTSITGNTTFNTTSGQHTLYLFANNTDGNLTSDSVIFTVNQNIFKVIYNEYAGSKRGTSTDFNKSSYEDLQNLSNINLENTDWGRIQFYEGINITADASLGDGITNLNNNTNISENRIELNSTALPNFNTSATLYLYNLTFSDPRILRDSSVCPDAICTEIDYTGGTLIFNITQFTTYSAEETPVISTPASPGGGGGGSSITSFTLDKTQISASLIPGEIKTTTLVITNDGNRVAEIEIENTLPNFVTTEETSFKINPGESKILRIDLIARQNAVPELYLGKIIVREGSVIKEVLVAIEIESDGALLDVKAKISDNYKKVLAGENLVAEIRLFNLGIPDGRRDILLEYIIKDFDENIIFDSSESVAIETQTTFTKRFEIPSDAKTGKYILYVKSVYDGKTASSTDTFEVVLRKVTIQEKIYIGIIIFLVIVFSLVVYSIFIRHRTHHRGFNRRKSSEKRKEGGRELIHIMRK